MDILQLRLRKRVDDLLCRHLGEALLRDIVNRDGAL